MSELIMTNLIERQRDWSLETFGPGRATDRICAHIREELIEITSTPDDLDEWVDVMLLAMDGAWRSVHTPGEIIRALHRKQSVNSSRQWPEPTSDQPCHHAV